MLTINRRYLIVTANATMFMLFGMRTSSATPLPVTHLRQGVKVSVNNCLDWNASKTATIYVDCSIASSPPPSSSGSSCRNSQGDPCGSTYEQTLAGGKLNK